MEERKLNEQESLELITQMIQNSKKNLQLGNGNLFLLWGYLCSITAIAIYILIEITDSTLWNWLWFAIPVIGYSITYWQTRNQIKPVLTYTDKVIKTIWKIIGQYGMFIGVVCCLYFNTLPLFPPIVMIMCSLGVCITGSIINDKFMSNCSGCGLAIGILMLSYVINPPELDVPNLGFAFSFIIMMVIPGHRLNKEAKRLCSKN